MRSKRYFPLGTFGLICTLTFFSVLSDVGVCGQPKRKATELQVATWNIENLGNKGTDSNKLHMVSEVLYDYDFIAITELRDPKVLKRIQSWLSKRGRAYDYLVSRKVGELKVVNGKLSKKDERIHPEYYAFLYYRGLVNVVDPGGLFEDDQESVENPKGKFTRDPYWATFRAGRFDFSVAVTHIFYSDKATRYAELGRLQELYNWVDKKNGDDEDDILLVGDFNLGPKSSSTQKSPFDRLMKDKPKVTPLFLEDAGDRSNTRDTELYDNIFFHTDDVREYTGHCGVYKFEQDICDGDISYADTISNHRPVWATFRIDLEDDDNETESKEKRGAVYIERRGDEYHKRGCNHRDENSTINVKISLYESKQRGLKPCSLYNDSKNKD